MIGVYWGAFDPPTVAHFAIIRAALTDIPVKKIVVVVNNHKYKNYVYPLEVRLKVLKKMLQEDGVEDAELLFQDEKKKMDYEALKSLFQAPLCAIAGYDAYVTWLNYSTALERKLYEAIAVVPRGNEDPKLFDSNAFLLNIKEKYSHISSTKIRGL